MIYRSAIPGAMQVTDVSRKSCSSIQNSARARTSRYDALGSRVEQTAGSATTEILYGPDGSKLALMNGSNLTKAFVPLPGGATAVYNGATLGWYRHADWLP